MGGCLLPSHIFFIHSLSVLYSFPFPRAHTLLLFQSFRTKEIHKIIHQFIYSIFFFLFSIVLFRALAQQFYGGRHFVAATSTDGPHSSESASSWHWFFFLISELFIHRMFRSRFLLFIRYSYSIHRCWSTDLVVIISFVLSFWSCGAYARLTFAQLWSFHCTQKRRYFQFIFLFVDFRRFTKVSLIFYWIGYCGQFL